MDQGRRKGPRVLLFDIETAPMLAYVWGLWDQTVGLNQIKSDWHLLSWSAKWLGDPPSKIMYQDQRRARDIQDDTELLKKIWKLLDEADIVITQNGKSFDEKKLNARFLMAGMQPPSSFKHIDTKRIASKKFAFTSNKLEYMTSKLCTRFKKLKTKKFQGFELWRACLNGVPAAWREMEEYNKHDVLSLEELYLKLAPWDPSIKFSPYYEEIERRCNCGSTDFRPNGFNYTSLGKYQRYRCGACGAEYKDRRNLLTKVEKAKL